MSRKVVLQVPIEVIVRDRDMKLLAAVDSRAAGSCREVAVPIRVLASDLDISVDTVRRALTACIAEGYLTARENRLENYCQMENIYALTASGARVLHAARDAGIVA